MLSSSRTDPCATQYPGPADADNLRERWPFLDFVPYDKQLAIQQSVKQIRVVAAANRTGKTAIGASECVLAGMCEHEYSGVVLPGSIAPIYPSQPFHMWACSVDYKQMRGSIIPAFEESINCPVCSGKGHSEGDTCPQCLGRGVRKPRLLPEGVRLNESKMNYKLPNGSVIWLKSADSGRKAFQGASLPLIWIDEEFPEEIVREIIMRIGAGFTRRILWTLTAVSGLSYPYFTWHLPWKTWAEEHPGESHPRIDCFQMSIWDNPHLIASEIDDIIADFPAGSKELKVRTEGGFIDLLSESYFSDACIEHHQAQCKSVERQRRVLLRCDYIELMVKTGLRYPPRGIRVEDCSDLEPLGWDIYHEPEPGHHYVAACDCMEGALSNPQDEESPRDFGPGGVWDRTAKRLAAVQRSRCDPHTNGEQLWLVGHWYNNAWVSPEVNKDGIAALGVLTGRTGWPTYGRIYRRQKDWDEWTLDNPPDDLAWKTTPITRPELIALLYTILEDHRDTVRINYPLIPEEMKAFQRDKKGKIQAIPGYHDDLLIMLGICFMLDKWCPAGDLPPVAAQTGKPTKKQFDQTRIEGGRGKTLPPLPRR